MMKTANAEMMPLVMCPRCTEAAWILDREFAPDPRCPRCGGRGILDPHEDGLLPTDCPAHEDPLLMPYVLAGIIRPE